MELEGGNVTRFVHCLQAGSKISLAKGESSLGFNDPLRKIISTKHCLPLAAGELLRRLWRSRTTSEDDCPDPMTAIRRGRSVASGVRTVERIGSIEVA